MNRQQKKQPRITGRALGMRRVMGDLNALGRSPCTTNHNTIKELENERKRRTGDRKELLDDAKRPKRAVVLECEDEHYRAAEDLVRLAAAQAKEVITNSSDSALQALLPLLQRKPQEHRHSQQTVCTDAELIALVDWFLSQDQQNMQRSGRNAQEAQTSSQKPHQVLADMIPAQHQKLNIRNDGDVNSQDSGQPSPFSPPPWLQIHSTHDLIASSAALKKMIQPATQQSKPRYLCPHIVGIMQPKYLEENANDPASLPYLQAAASMLEQTSKILPGPGRGDQPHAEKHRKTFTIPFARTNSANPVEHQRLTQCLGTLLAMRARKALTAVTAAKKAVDIAVSSPFVDNTLIDCAVTKIQKARDSVQAFDELALVLKERNQSSPQC